jgi:4-guanidinobutyraldehyde dehydrogenase/NAD-dependent aldehyde dehydrogenase
MIDPLKLDSGITEILSADFCQPLIYGRDGSLTNDQIIVERDTWSGLKLPLIVQSTEMDVKYAVQIALDAFDHGSWRGVTKQERGRTLLRWASLIEHNAKQLATINCLETGRSLKSLEKDSIPKAVDALRWFAELIDKIDDRSVISGRYGSNFALIHREPLGVIAVILPWNDPLVTFVWKVGPALAMGNAVIVKPSEHATQVISQALLLAYKAGVPRAQVQMLTGNGNVGRLLVEQPDVSKIAFTGSTKTAAEIGFEAHRIGLKRLSFECGGKGAFVFGESGRNPAEFAKVVANGIFYNQGQTCSAPSIVHVPRSMLTKISEYLCEESLKYLPQHPFSHGCVGLMISRSVVARTKEALSQLSKDMFIRPSNELRIEPEFSEWAMIPTVLTGLPESHYFWDTELFAPVLLIRAYDDVMEAVAKANSSKFGLASGVWSQDIDECMEIARKLQSGNVHINSWGNDPNQVPFGGIKNSGSGREKSIDTMNDYSYIKSIFYQQIGG